MRWLINAFEMVRSEFAEKTPLTHPAEVNLALFFPDGTLIDNPDQQDDGRGSASWTPAA